MHCIVVFPIWDRAQCTAITSSGSSALLSAPVPCVVLFFARSLVHQIIELSACYPISPSPSATSPRLVSAILLATCSFLYKVLLLISLRLLRHFMLQVSLNKLKLANRIVKCALRYPMAHNAYHGRERGSVPYTVHTVVWRALSTCHWLTK